MYHGGSVRKIVADAGSAGGNTSSTAVLDGFDGDMSVAQRLQSFGALLERPSNLHALCGWLLVRHPPHVGHICFRRPMSLRLDMPTTVEHYQDVCTTCTDATRRHCLRVPAPTLPAVQGKIETALIAQSRRGDRVFLRGCSSDRKKRLGAQERSVMPKDPADVGSIKEQLEAEQAYQDGQGIVPLLPTIHNPTLVITATNDMTNPPSNQVRSSPIHPPVLFHGLALRQ